MRKRASGVPVSQLRHRTAKRRGREKVFPLKIYVNADTKVGRIFHLVPGRVDPEETPSLIRRTCFFAMAANAVSFDVLRFGVTTPSVAVIF